MDVDDDAPNVALDVDDDDDGATKPLTCKVRKWKLHRTFESGDKNWG